MLHKNTKVYLRFDIVMHLFQMHVKMRITKPPTNLQLLFPILTFTQSGFRLIKNCFSVFQSITFSC